MPRRAIQAPDRFDDILARILAAAAEAGITQADLARRAGVAPATLSRALSRHNADFGLVARLAGIVGLRLALVPDDELSAAVRRGDFF